MRQRIFAIADRAGEYATYAFFFFLPISKALVEICVGVIFLAFIVRKIVRPDFAFVRERANLCVLVLMLFCALSLVNSQPFVAHGLRAFFLKWLKYTGQFIIIQDTFTTRARIVRLLWSFSLGALLVCVSGISQIVFGAEFLRQRPLILNDLGVPSATSTFDDFNSFGTYLIVAIMTAAGMYLHLGKNTARWLMLTTIAFGFVCSIFSYSRGGWFGLLFACAVMYILLRSRQFAVMMSLFALILLLSPPFHQRILSVEQFINFDGNRMEMWRGTMAMIRAHPFLGIGLGTFMARFRDYMPPIQISYAHNCYLQIWAECGFFALLSFLSFVGVLLHGGIGVCRRRGADPLVVGVLAGLTGFLVHSFFDTQLYSLQLALLFWAFSGVLQALVRMSALCGEEPTRECIAHER